MVYRERRVRGSVPRECGQRYLRATRGLAHIDLVERFRRLPILWSGFHHHVVLVERRVDRRDLALAERVVQRGVNELRAYAEARGGVPVDHERGLQPLVLHVGVDVGELWQVVERCANARLPGTELGEIVCLQRVLIRCVALPAADADVLHGVQEQIGPRLLGELDAQTGDDLVGALFALRKRLERDEHRTGVALLAAGEAHHVVDGGIGTDDVDEVGELLAHRLEGNALVSLNEADQSSGVLLREEALGNDDIEVDIQAYRDQQNEHREHAVAQYPGQASLVAAQDVPEAALAPREQPRWAALGHRAQQT